MKRTTIFQMLLIITIFANYNNLKADICSGVCPIQSLCLNPCNPGWITGSFTTNGKQPLLALTQGREFSVQRLDVGLYAITFKKPFCCPISVVASSNVVETTKSSIGCGSPVFLKNYPTGQGPIRLAVSPDKKCLAVVNFIDQDISVFKINPNCTLQEIPVRPKIGSSNITYGAAYSSQCLAVTNQSDNTLSIFTSSDCNLTPIPSPMPSSSPMPSFASFSPDGTCLAISNLGDNVSFFSIENCIPTFKTKLSGLPGNQVATFLSNKCLALLNNNNNESVLESYSINNCSPSNIVSSSNLGKNIFTTSLPFSPTNNCLAVSGVTNLNPPFDSFIHTFEMDGCALTKKSTTSTGNLNSFALDYSLDGNCLVALNSPTLLLRGESISIFSVDSNCALHQVSGSPFPLPSNTSGPIDIKFITSDCFVTANILTNNISVFRLSRPFTTTFTGIKICESITPGCFIVQLPPEADACATVTFFATPCT